METFETIKKFLSEGGKCLLIENGKSIGVVLTMEEYEKLKENKKSELLMSDTELLMSDINKSDTKENPIPMLQSEAEKSLFPETNLAPQTPPVVSHPIGEAMAKEMDFSDLPDEALAKAGASANIDEINLTDASDVTLEDLGLDELPY